MKTKLFSSNGIIVNVNITEQEFETLNSCCNIDTSNSITGKTFEILSSSLTELVECLPNFPQEIAERCATNYEKRNTELPVISYCFFVKSSYPILWKTLDEVTNYDLAMVGLPDSVGSFLIALIEDKWGLVWMEVKNSMTLEEVVTRYSRMKGKN